MLAFVICFIFSPVFTYSAEKSFKKNQKKNGIFFSIIAILIPTIIAALRSEEIGRDIKMYVAPYLELANYSSASRYWTYYKIANLEKGYALMVFFMSFITTDYHVLLFFIHLLPIVAVFYFAYYNKDEISMTLVMIVYLLLWYSRGYTIMRQSIAMGFIILSLINFDKNKMLKSFIWFVCAILFHSSAIISIGFYIIIFVNRNVKKISDKILTYFVMFVVLGIIIAFYKQIIYFFTIKINLLPRKFYNYLNSQTFAREEFEISFSQTLIRVIWIFFGILGINILKNDKNKEKFFEFFLCLIFELFLYTISFSISNAIRLGYYYFYISLLYFIPSLTKIFAKSKSNQILANMILITILLVFWVYLYPVRKTCEVYPYKSDVVSFFNY